MRLGLNKRENNSLRRGNASNVCETEKMIHANREDIEKRDQLIAAIDLKEREVKHIEEEARSGVVKVVCQTEIGDREKDRVESEIAVATFAELVSVTSGQHRRLRNAMKILWLFV